MRTSIFTKSLAVGLAGLMFLGCATAPRKISASYVSPLQYSDLTCREIRGELLRVNRRLTEASGVQQGEATKDAVALGVGLILFWPAVFFMIGSDKEQEIAGLKGEYEALESAAIKNECEFVPELEAAREERERLEDEQAEAEKKRRKHGPRNR